MEVDPRRAPVAGQVPMLFVDLEGSTRHALALGDAWPDLLTHYRRLLREAIASTGGTVESTEGDSFFAIFGTTADAVAAAAAAQRALRAAPWPPEAGELRARMGVHVGEAIRTDGHLVGVEVHRAARVAGAAHGGQVLVTEPVEEEVGAVWDCQSLGRHRLKDFADPIGLWHVVVDDDRDAASFPPPRAAQPPLPEDPVLAAGPATPTLGRERELQALEGLLGPGGARLLTLVGPGGVGKTRLAIEAGRAAAGRFADGARLVSLGSVDAAERVPGTIARELRVAAVPGEEALDAVARSLARREILLILDNFEHVLDAAGVVGELLQRCPRLTVLTTSREALKLAAERRVTVEPLRSTTDGGGSAPAVELLLQRAHLGRPADSGGPPEQEALAEICRQLDGLPLALELVAPALQTLSAVELSRRLQHNRHAIAFPARDVPERQQTLHSTLAWSHDLLTPAEQQAFARFGAFARGGTTPTVEAVTGADLGLLRALVDKSLLVADAAGGAPRLRMLQTVRDYARERLQARGELEELRRRHLDHFLVLTEAKVEVLRQTGSPEAAEELDAEADELRAAMSWAIAEGPPEEALRMATAISYYWRTRDPLEAGPWLGRALQRAEGTAAPAHMAAGLHQYAFYLRRTGAHAEAEAAARRSLELHEELEHDEGAARSATGLAWILFARDRLDEAGVLAGRAIASARRAGDPITLAQALAAQASVSDGSASGQRAGEEAARLFRAAGHHQGLSWLQSDLAYAALKRGEDRLAAQLASEAVAEAERGGGWTDAAFASGNYALASLFAGHLREAAAAFCRELEVVAEYDLADLLFEGLHGLAAVFAAWGQDETAARLAGAATALSPERHDPQVESRIGEILEPARRRDLGRWRENERQGQMLGREEAIGFALSAAGHGTRP